MTANKLESKLQALANPRVASDLQWFFKTGPGEYGEGDQFIGLKVPQIREVIKPFKDLPDDQIEELVQSPIHEVRFAALAILTGQFERERNPGRQEEIFNLYMKFVDQGKVNNWDLVDLSANRIGAWLIGKPFAKEFLVELARSESLWHQRVAVLFTFAFIKQHELDETFMLAELLVNHDHDLIQKAVGWMLREAGKRDTGRLRAFLETHAATMPRTMLRYSIEKLTDAERRDWLSRRSR